MCLKSNHMLNKLSQLRQRQPQLKCLIKFGLGLIFNHPVILASGLSKALQGWAKKWVPGLVNFVPTFAYHFYYLNVPEKILATRGLLFSPCSKIALSLPLAEFRWIIFVDQYWWSSMSMLSFLQPAGFLNAVKLFKKYLNLLMKTKPHLVWHTSTYQIPNT